jgi:hypothetical protein
MRRLILAAALALVACGSRETAVPHGGLALPFIENDYAGALARAREASLPVFVEVWAPW